MAEEKHHHHLFHHKDKEEEGGPVDYEKEIKHHKHLEEIGELGTAAAGVYALVNIMFLYTWETVFIKLFYSI